VSAALFDRFVEAPGARPPEGAEIVLLERPDGASLRCARLPHPAPSGAAVVTTGWNEFLEKYFETAEALRARGLSVMLYDTRGQGLSSRPLDDRTLGHLENFSECVGDLAAVAARARADAPEGAPLYLAGHSMGGLVTLKTIADGAVSPAAAAVTAPMTRLFKAPLALAAVGALAKALCAVGLGSWKVAGASPTAPVFENNPFTSDKARYDRFKALQAAAPGAVMRGPTNAWVAAAIRAGRDLVRDLPRCEIPFLIASAGDERVVAGIDHEALAASAPNGRHVLIDGARHEIFVEADARRETFWAAFDALRAEVEGATGRDLRPN